MADGSIWDEVLDTENAMVVSQDYIERRPRKNLAPEKVLIVVVEPDDEARNRCPKCGKRGIPVEPDVRRGSGAGNARAPGPGHPRLARPPWGTQAGSPVATSAAGIS